MSVEKGYPSHKTAKDSLLSSTPHAPRHKKSFLPFSHYHPNVRQRKFLDNSKIKAWSNPNLLTTQDKKEITRTNEFSNRQKRTETDEIKEPIIVKPFRRTKGDKAPDCVPKLDLSKFNEPDELMESVTVLPSIIDDSTSRTDYSWGVFGCPERPKSPEITKKDLQLDQLSSSPSHSSIIIDDDGSTNLHKKDYIEHKIISNERSNLELLYTKESEEKVGMVPETSLLSKRVRFDARILSQNGRDVHRDLCGFFFLSDGTMTIYEFRQFGQRFSALPLIPRGVYCFLKDKKKGNKYEINHIKKGSTLYFETASLSSLPESLKRRHILAIRITNVDEQAKWNMMTNGLKPTEYCKVKTYLSQKVSDDPSHMLTTLQGMLCNRLQGRASKTLVGLGRLLRDISSEDQLVSKSQLQQALRTFHIGLTPEDFNQLWESLCSSHFVNDRDGGSGQSKERVQRVWLDHCISGMIGQLNEERQIFLRKVFKKLDPCKTGSIHLSQLYKYYLPSNHPDVLNGTKTSQQILTDLVGILQVTHPAGNIDRNLITYADFEHYYWGVSVETKADHEYIHLLRRCWSL